MQIEMVNERFSQNKETENNLKLLRHDIKHRLIPLSGYIDNKDFDKAREYMNKLMEDIDRNTIKTYCQNNMVNVVLSYYHNIAMSKEIDFQAHIRLPENLSINETDLAVILSNSLENTINALKECKNKHISIKAFFKNRRIYIEIKNPFKGKIVFEDNLPQASVENHGYGTKSIATIIKKYDGIYSFVTENDCFVFRCAV